MTEWKMLNDNYYCRYYVEFSEETAEKPEELRKRLNFFEHMVF